MTKAHAVNGDLLRAAARTDPGRMRSNNEDLPVIDAARGIFGVIDGIGGQAGGEIAAATARDVILQRLARPRGTPAERVREAIAIANNAIYRRSQESRELHGMACVITLAIIADGRLTIGHVGDSRLYKVRPDGLHKLTRDHSPVGEREESGELSEVDAMRHPRRNEVFREVGGVYRDKDEPEFVDVIEEPLERDSAILLCSDGLTDMLPGSTIAHVIRQHTGNPERVVDALVAAANDAGGKDNITVVYVEMPRFARVAGHGAAEELTPTEPPTSDRTSTSQGDVEARGTGLRRLARSVIASRTTWFAAGMLAGVVGAVMLTLHVATTQVPASQVLVVAADGSTPFTGITAAIDAARPGDTIRVEPGLYRERVHLRGGIDLVARAPGTVTIGRPEGLDAAVAGVTIGGGLNVRISGIRIESPDAADVAIRIAGPAASLELVEISGQFRRAIALSPASSLTMYGSRIAVSGIVIAVPDAAHATLVNNIIARTGTSQEPPISLTPSAQLILRGNVFSGYGTDIVKGVADAQRKDMLSGNIIVGPEQNRSTGASRNR